MHIYKWTHKESGKVYVGQSVQTPERRIYEVAMERWHFDNCKEISQ